MDGSGVVFDVMEYGYGAKERGRNRIWDLWSDSGVSEKEKL